MNLVQININRVHCLCRCKQNGGYSAVHYHAFQTSLFFCLLSKIPLKYLHCFRVNLSTKYTVLTEINTFGKIGFMFLNESALDIIKAYMAKTVRQWWKKNTHLCGCEELKMSGIWSNLLVTAKQFRCQTDGLTCKRKAAKNSERSWS